MQAPIVQFYNLIYWLFSAFLKTINQLTDSEAVAKDVGLPDKPNVT